MKNITPILLAGATLALCGCNSDTPIFSTPATKASAAQAGPSKEEQARDIYNTQNSGASMGQQAELPGAGASKEMQESQAGNPYGH
jgi:hypothetical protein